MTLDLKTTFDLVLRAKEGDRAALSALFREYEPLVKSAARRAVGPRLRAIVEPQDVAQSALREAVRDFDRFDYRREGAFRKWLEAIVANKARDIAIHWKARKRDPARALAIEGGRDAQSSSGFGIPSPDPTVSQFLAAEDRARVLRATVRNLPERWRRAIEHAYFERLSYREIADRMALPSEDSVRMLLRRAEKALRRLLPAGLSRES